MAEHDTAYYLEHVDPEDWPTQHVTCTTPGCMNEGIVLEVPDIGQAVMCGGCGVHIIEPARG